MSRVLTALGAKEYKVGDEVVFFTTPSKHSGSDPELRDVARRGVAKVVGVTMGFTAFGPKEVVPYYDVLLPDGKVVREVSPHYFEVEWPKPRNNLDTAFNRVMKALKPLGLSRVRSNVRAGERTLEPQFDKPISVKHVVSLLEGAGIAVDNNGYFTVDVQATKSGTYATYRGRVYREGIDNDKLLHVSFGFSPEVQHSLSGRYASQKEGTTAPRALTASDRSSLIRLASSLPAGSAERKAILAGLHLQGSDKSIDKSARGSRTAAKRGDIVFLSKSILDFFQEKVVPKGQYVVGKTMKGEVSLRPYPLSAHPGYLVDAAVLAAAMTLAGPSKSASFSPNAMEALSAPADAGTMRGAKKWMGLLRMVILGDTTTGSSERAALIREAKKQMSYAMFLFAQNKGLVAYYKDQKKELDSLQDVAQD